MVVVGERKKKKIRQFVFLKGHDFAAENRRKGLCQCNQDRYGWKGRDGSILGLLFDQLDRYQNTEGKLF